MNADAWEQISLLKSVADGLLALMESGLASRHLLLDRGIRPVSSSIGRWAVGRLSVLKTPPAWLKIVAVLPG